MHKRGLVCLFVRDMQTRYQVLLTRASLHVIHEKTRELNKVSVQIR